MKQESTEMHTFSLEETAILIASGETGRAQDILCERITQVPDDYQARILLRESFKDAAPATAVESGLKSCPCCGNTFSVFLPGGPSFRPDACCPACESLERHRFLCLFLARSFQFDEGETSMLHIAAEPCLRAQFQDRLGDRYHSMDLFSKADIQGDLCSMPIQSESIDIFMANHVLEHVLDDVAAMREMHRILKPSGVVLLQIPMDRTLAVTQEAPEGATPQDLLRLFGQDDHVRMYGNDFRSRLESAGFTVRENRCGDIATADELSAHGLYPDEIVWEAVK